MKREELKKEINSMAQFFMRS